MSCLEEELEDVKALREWAKMQPHLPNIDVMSDVCLSSFLRRRYYSLERAKQTLDNFLTFRTLVPEICHNRSLYTPQVQTLFQSQYHGVVNELGSGRGAVIFFHSHDPDPSKYDCNAFAKVYTMMMDAWTSENASTNGFTLVFDQQNFTFSHLLRVIPTTTKKMNYFNKDCAPVSVKNIYVINSIALTQKMLTFFRPLIDGEIFEQIKVFTSSQMEELYKYIPKEMLPHDYGGKAGTMAELHKKTIDLFQRNQDYFKKLDTLKVDESKRRGPVKNINTIFGLEGTFKKLDVD